MVDLVFEDPQRGTCYEDDRWLVRRWRAAQVVISGLNASGTGVDSWGPSSGVVFERVFARGYDVAIEMGGVDGITFTKNRWHHQMFGRGAWPRRSLCKSSQNPEQCGRTDRTTRFLHL